MVRLKSIEIFGFKSSNRIARAVFSEANVSVVYGPNGCGKTSFLKVLHGVMAQDDTALTQNSVESVRIVISTYGDESAISVVKNAEGAFVWDEILNSALGFTKSLSLGVDRGITNQAVKTDPALILEFFRHPRRRAYLSSEFPMFQVAEDLAGYLRHAQAARYRSRNNEVDYEKRHLYLQNIKIENIEELLVDRFRIARMMATRKIQSALFDTLSVAISLDEQPSRNEKLPLDFEQRLVENRARIIEALDDGSENQFKSKVIETLDTISHSDGIDKIRRHPILSQLFLNIIEELEMEKLKLSSINFLIDTFNSYLIEGKRLVVSGKEAKIVVSGAEHSINDLSSGERHILTFLSLVLFQGDGRDFLIIDEPEISLNITWQRELMGLFSKLVPNTQIIVASHSPSLVRHNQDYLTELSVEVLP
ncbi:AAA family ATPase [Pseudomonas sp. B22129]|uniref:AAA family ATPase n=1 Tax=Pseudomonas sp. B22129 TaxID=3235111 RepID=UPI00378530D6